MIFYCYHGGIICEKRINASPNGAGGLASRKPEKNKGSKKADLKTFYSFFFFRFFFPHFRNKVPVPGRHGETNNGGAGIILFLVSFLI
jgi:hypothetical protein